MTQNTNDNGVSPVIAVLLILAITVVAAGVVAVVATGMTGELQNGKQVGLIVKPAASGGDVLVTVVSGKDVPELTKLEVIDGGSTDAMFQEVRLSDGGNVASFTAGAGYVARNVAFPENGRKSYTTPIVVKGTFKDGTETVLLNTRLTFTDVVVSPLKGKIHEFYVTTITGEKWNLLDLFLYGIPITLKYSDIKSENNHYVKIQIPNEMLDENTYTRLTLYTIDSYGNEIKSTNTKFIGHKYEETIHEVDKENVVGVVAKVELYDKTKYVAAKKKLDEYQKKLNQWIADGRDPTTEPEQPPDPEAVSSIGTQSVTINIDNSEHYNK
ncbi:MAG: type IV pilin [Methanocorpusculum sp.]|nr:type IV pilin [Methanocorpusculum sp.]